MSAMAKITRKMKNTAGTELLILERDGRIGLDYSFDEAV